MHIISNQYLLNDQDQNLSAKMDYSLVFLFGTAEED